jgi:hypothetical protein
MNEPAQFMDLPEMHPPSGDGNEWMVMQEWVSPPLNGKCVAIRAGFVTDGASIPQWCWSLEGSPMTVPMLGPAICHDALYAGELVKDHSTADWMLLQYMCMTDMSWLHRNTIWLAVRAFGWIVWNKHTPASISASRNMCQLIDAGATPIWPKIEGVTVS